MSADQPNDALEEGPRKPTDEEWSWAFGRLTGRGTTRHYPASAALTGLVWSAVHQHGWSLPDVNEWRIDLRRYRPEDDGWDEMHVWRDRLGRCQGAERFVTQRAGKSRTIAETHELLA